MKRVNAIISHPVFQRELKKIESLEQKRAYCRHDLGHLLEVARIAYIMALEEGHQIQPDIVYAAALLHDIGKIFEYTINTESGLIDYDETFRKEWISHSQYGFSICMTSGFKRVAKMIAAHHARAEWGAIVDLNEKDLEPILYLIHHIDDLSAKFGRTNVAMLK